MAPAASSMTSEKWMADLKACLDVESEDFRCHRQTMRTDIYLRHMSRLQPEARARVILAPLSLFEIIDLRMSYNPDAVTHYEKMEDAKGHGLAVIQEVDARSLRRRGAWKPKKDAENPLLLAPGNKEETKFYKAEIFYDSADAIIKHIKPRLGVDVFNLFGKGEVDLGPRADDIESLDAPPSSTELKASKADKHKRLVVGPPPDGNIETDLIALKIEEYQQLLVGSLVSASFKKRIADIINVLQSWLEGKIRTGNQVSETLSDLEDEVETQLDQGYEDLLDSMASVTAQRDLLQLKDFLSKSLLEEYGMCTAGSISRVDKDWKLRGLYLEWKRAPCDVARKIEVRLSEETGIHPSQLDYCIGERLDRMISAVDLDEDWVKDRIWSYANDHTRLYICDRLADEFRWETLARKILRDREQLELLIPKNAVFADYDRKSDEKAHIHFGIVCTQTTHFAKLKGTDNFILSKKAKERLRQAERSSTRSGEGRSNTRKQEKLSIRSR